LTPNSSSNSSSGLRRALLQDFASSSSSNNMLLSGFEQSSRQLLQVGTGQIPVQGRVSIRESPADAGSSSSTGETTALDNSGDIVVVGGPPDTPNSPVPPQVNPGDNNSSSSDDDSGKAPTPPQQGSTGDNTQGEFPAPLPTVNLPSLSQAVRPKLLIVLAAIAAPSCVALCAVCIAAAVIYKRRKRQDQQQQQQQPGGEQVAGANTPTGAGNSNQLSSKARRRLPSGPGNNNIGFNNNSSISSQPTSASEGNGGIEGADQASVINSNSSAQPSDSSKTGKKKAKKGELASTQPSPPTLELSSNGGYASEQQGRYNTDTNTIGTSSTADARDHPGEVTASRIEFLDPDELQRATTSSDGGTGLRRIPYRDSIDLSSFPEPGSAAPHKQGRLGSLAGSVAGMASSVAAAIGNRMRSSQAGAAYRVPGLEPATGKRGNRGSMELQMPAGERGPTLPGARAASVLVPAAQAVQLSAAVAQQVNSSTRKQQKKAAGVNAGQPAMWLLPTANEAADMPLAAAATNRGATGESQHNSRRPAGAGVAAGGSCDRYDGVGLQETAAGEVVMGGSTLLVPSRSRVNVNLNSHTGGRQQQQQSARSPPAWG
jgi:hypothetical protein